MGGFGKIGRKPYPKPRTIRRYTMLIGDIIKCFSLDTKYKIVYADNPHNIVYTSQGNRLTKFCDDSEIKSIYIKDKYIIICI